MLLKSCILTLFSGSTVAQSTDMIITHISLSTHSIDKVDKDHTWDDKAKARHDYALPDILKKLTILHKSASNKKKNIMAEVAPVFSTRQYIYTKMAGYVT